MAQVPVVNVEGERVGEMNLADGVFGQERNDHLMHAAVVAHLARRRVGTASTLTRAEVSGGGRKPWRQKGTGRARHGSIRSPLWRKGGVVFGPRPRDYGYAIPVKARRQALRSALSTRVREGAVTVVCDLALAAPRTRELATILKKLGVEGSALIVTADRDRNLELSARNLPGVDTALAHQLHTYQVLGHDFLVFTPEAVQRVEEVLS